MKWLPIYNAEFASFLREFDKAVETQGYSRGKCNGKYVTEVREFFFFCENRGITSVKQVKATDIVAYFDYIRERPNQRREGTLSESMIRNHMFSLRLFFDFMVNIGELESSPAHLPKFSIGKYKERNIVTQEEIGQIYFACESKRDRALISVAYGCGLRRSEIEKLNVTDVLFHKGVLTVRQAKGNKSRTIPISDAVLKDLKTYIIYERPKYFHSTKFETSHAFFVSNRGTRIPGDKLNMRLKELIVKTQNPELQRKNITLHCLRHSIATHLLDNGAAIEFVQKFLGHACIDTSHLYSKKRVQRLKIINAVKENEAKAKDIQRVPA